MSNIGRVIYGFCNGYFGRDDYSDKVIVFETKTSICCRYLSYGDNDKLTCCNFDTEKEKNECIEKWSVEENYD